MTDIRFVKITPPMWNGNGFGTSTAEWVAFAGDVEIGHYFDDGRDVDLYGQRWFYGVNRWKQDVRKFAPKYL